MTPLSKELRLYHGELTEAMEGRQQGDFKSLRNQWKKRGRCWMKKEYGAEAMPRPAKRQRTSAWEWLNALDNAMRTTVGKQLKDFRKADACMCGPEDTMGADDGLSWPSLRIGLDRGSDGRSACSFLLYNEAVRSNIEPIWDPSHDVSRDVEGAIRDMDVFPLVILTLVVWNLPFGPWDQGARHQQVVAAMEEYFKGLDRFTCPLFDAMKDVMAEEMQVNLLGDDEDTTSAQIWEAFRNCHLWHAKGASSVLSVIPVFRHQMQRCARDVASVCPGSEFIKWTQPRAWAHGGEVKGPPPPPLGLGPCLADPQTQRPGRLEPRPKRRSVKSVHVRLKPL